LSLALLTSGWKVSLPSFRGTMSANFLYVLIGIVELSLAETLVIGCASVLLQYIWKARSRVRLVNSVFNVTSIAIAIQLTHLVFYSSFLKDAYFQFPFRLTLASTVYFVANTAPISFVIAATEHKKVIANWRECFFWSFPYYLVGAAI